MTSAEVAMKLNVSENYVRKHFKRLQESLKRRGILLVKIGRGPDAIYKLGSMESTLLE